MATAQDFATQAAAFVLGQTSASARFLHDYRGDRDALALGGTAYQLRVAQVGLDVRDSVNTVALVEFEVEMHHRLADWKAERAWTEAAALADQAILTDPDAWKAGVASLLEWTEGPELDALPERDGDRLRYIVKGIARLRP